jgi:cytochrome P450
MPYGIPWRQNRRAFHQYLNANAVPRYHPIMLEETKSFLRKVKSNSDPEQVFEDLQLYAEHLSSNPFRRLTSNRKRLV